MKNRKKRTKGQAAKTDTTHTQGRSARPVITVDYEKYAHFLEDSDLTEEQKQEFLQTLWNIIVEFVSMGVGVHPVQQAQNSCGQLAENGLKPPLAGPDGVLLGKEILTENFVNASGLETGAGAEGVEK